MFGWQYPLILREACTLSRSWCIVLASCPAIEKCCPTDKFCCLKDSLSCITTWIINSFIYNGVKQKMHFVFEVRFIYYKTKRVYLMNRLLWSFNYLMDSLEFFYKWPSFLTTSIQSLYTNSINKRKKIPGLLRTVSLLVFRTLEWLSWGCAGEQRSERSILGSFLQSTEMA